MMIPSRFQNLDEARSRFGDRVDRLAPFLLQGDPLADALVESMEDAPPSRGFAAFQDALHKPTTRGLDLPPAMRAFFDEVERVPAWVDWGAIQRGGELLLRSGMIGGFVLAAASLILGYASPGGNKPLVFSGRLVERAPRRLGETSRFVQATALPGGLRRNGAGYGITLKVRVMHAKVRRMLRRSPKWNTEMWGDPVNQHDMVGTSMLFSLVFLEGIRAFGIHVDPDEAESFMHLWRYSGHLIGVDPELLPASESDAWRLANLIRATEGPPDDDSRELTRALFQAIETGATPDDRRLGRLRREVGQGVCRGLVGEELADRLGVPRTRFIAAFHALRTLTRVAEKARRRSDEAHRLAVVSGTRYWERVVALSLEGKPADFIPPEHLSRAA
jgi:hypothetical protein